MGWSKDRRKKIHTLAYANDVMLLAEEEQDMRSILKRLERYLDRKGIELNSEKTKVMKFRKRGGKKRKIEWR